MICRGDKLELTKYARRIPCLENWRNIVAVHSPYNNLIIIERDRIREWAKNKRYRETISLDFVRKL